MIYPTIAEYKEAILSAEDNFETLNQLRPVIGSDGEPIMTSGNFAVVFKMKDEYTGKFHAVKCFIKEQEGRAESYNKIVEELEFVNSPYFSRILYLDKELFVDSNSAQETEFPILLMDWEDGIPLDKYLRNHIDNQYELSLLAYQFSRLAMWLMPQPFAHGDLKPDNILVKEDGTLVLVDYDGMYVPAMNGELRRELGSPDFQHPSRTERSFDEHIDDFSIASILLSLKAIALRPDLLEKYGAQDRLLLSEKDYRSIGSCNLLKEIYPSDDSELNVLVSLFTIALENTNLSSFTFTSTFSHHGQLDIVGLFHLKRPRILQNNELSTNFTKDDIKNAWTDEFGVKYSEDRKRLIWAPKDIKEYSIRKGTEVICNYAFSRCYDLYSVQIPYGVVKIGTGAFEECECLTAMVIPYGVGTIHENTFLGCNKLLSISIPNSSFRIEENAFAGCENLAKLYIPDGVTAIGESAFENCSGLRMVSLPYSIHTLNDYAFWGCSSLVSINIPHGLRTIGKSAFENCSSLLSIKIPDTVYEIKPNAFKGCCSLSGLSVDKSNKRYDSRNDCNAIIDTENNVLAVGCTSSIIPKDVHTIGKHAFSGSGVTSIVIPENVTWIAEGAFSGCNDLTSVTILNEDCKFCTWEDSSFPACTINIPPRTQKVFESFSENKLYDPEYISPEVLEEEITNAWVDEFGVMYSEDGQKLLKAPDYLAEYEIKKWTKTICKDAFSNCKNLTTITIPDNVLWIGESAFYGCLNLKVVNMSKNIVWIGGGCFSGCKMLENINLPNTLKTIDEYAFKGCESLSFVKLPYELINISNGLFELCKNIKTIEMPTTSYFIGYSSFRGCLNLKEIIIPQTVNQIESNAFEKCESLMTIIVPNGVTRIEHEVFKGCRNLVSIILPQNISSIESDSISGCGNLNVIYIPEEKYYDLCYYSRSIKRLFVSYGEDFFKSHYSDIEE